MNNKQQMNIIIDVMGINETFGPITCCVIGVNINLTREFNLSALINAKSKKIFETIGKDSDILKYRNITEIPAKRVDNTAKQVTELVFDSLNTIHKFWEHKIFILSTDIKLNSIKLTPNIKKAKIYIGEKYCNKQIKKLIKYVHLSHYNNEIKLLKTVYGDTKCIHTRTKVKEVK